MAGWIGHDVWVENKQGALMADDHFESALLPVVKPAIIPATNQRGPARTDENEVQELLARLRELGVKVD